MITDIVIKKESWIEIISNKEQLKRIDLLNELQYDLIFTDDKDKLLNLLTNIKQITKELNKYEKDNIKQYKDLQMIIEVLF